jgi:hypothetical protein
MTTMFRWRQSRRQDDRYDIAFQFLSTGAYDLLVLDDYLSDRHCDFRRFTDQS